MEELLMKYLLFFTLPLYAFFLDGQDLSCQGKGIWTHKGKLAGSYDIFFNVKHYSGNIYVYDRIDSGDHVYIMTYKMIPTSNNQFSLQDEISIGESYCFENEENRSESCHMKFTAQKEKGETTLTFNQDRSVIERIGSFYENETGRTLQYQDILNCQD